MDTSTNGHATEAGEPIRRHEHDNLDTVPRGWRWSVPRFIGFAAFLAMTVFWIWAFANRDSVAHPDTFDDPVFHMAAESICEARQANISALPLATAAEDAVARGELLKLGTQELELMVTELGALPPPTDEVGADGVRQWLQDYELYLNDRREYAAVLATGDDPAFLISANAQGARVTDALQTFAEVNDMASCAPSGDV